MQGPSEFGIVGDAKLKTWDIKGELSTISTPTLIIGGITNRDYFKGISGVYFSLEDLDNYEIIIVYDTTIKRLHKVQVITRLRKLLGYDIEVNFGPLDEYLSRINEMMGIRRRSQYFGDNYFKKLDSEKSLR